MIDKELNHDIVKNEDALVCINIEGCNTKKYTV